MDVISYRGPGAAGGVSSGLANAWRSQKVSETSWWFLFNESLSYLQPDSTKPHFLTQLNERTVKGHYQFCNNFLWPIMHDLPVHATLCKEEFRHYKEFNRIFGQFIGFEQRKQKRFFVNDYQLATLPGFLAEAGGRVSVFWHIPWPKTIPAEYNSVLQEIARGLLNCRTLGFHTQEYADNFLSYVRESFPQIRIDQGSMRISFATKESQNAAEIENIFGVSSFITRPLRHLPDRKPFLGTQLVVAPLGIDQEQWFVMAAANADERVTSILQSAQDRRLVLSVDRADYTKAVADRIAIIDRFLSEHPSWQNRISFVQICGRSRSGLNAFDRYWDKCQQMVRVVNERWRTADWQPINWIEEPLPAQSLSVLYRHADTMLVTPVRDGLNLTAKEFIACQGDNSGVLLLSPGAGAWHELGRHALPADPLAPHKTADSLARALAMPPIERKWRNQQLKKSLQDNPLQNWWRAMTTAGHQQASAEEHSTEVSALTGDAALSA